MKNHIKRIPNNVQNRDSEAWKKLCVYIDELAESGGDEFSPREALGDDLFSEIYTLPESIVKLKKVTKVWLYGSNLKRIPPEIGQMESLEYFDPYTSYDLNWFPFEIMHCKSLVKSRISTRALLGSRSSGMGFPNLENSPIEFFQGNVKCSICQKQLKAHENKQMWITLGLGDNGTKTDYLPLLANICSQNCENKLHNLSKPPPYYRPYPHQGGVNLPAPEMTYHEWFDKYAIRIPVEESEPTNKPTSLLKLVKKIWNK